MSDNGRKLDKVLELGTNENLLVFEQTRKRIARFTSEPVSEPIRDYQLLSSPVTIISLIMVINEALDQAELFLLKFPQHQKPPEHAFVNTMSAFMHRHEAFQIDLDLYCKWNLDDLDIAKLYIEYRTFIQYMAKLLDTLHKSNGFKNFQASVNEMLELNTYVLKLENENLINIEYLRTQELRLINLCKNKTSAKEVKALVKKYDEIENDYHDSRIICAAQLRLNKTLFNAQLDQIKKRETKKANQLLGSSIEFERNSETETFVFEQSSKCSYLMIDECKHKIQEVSEKYENDLVMVEFEISAMQSRLNYFEEMWERKRIRLKFMKQECDNYVESVQQRKREAIAKRLIQPWIASARKTIAERKRKAKILAKKNKGKNVKRK